MAGNGRQTGQSRRKPKNERSAANEASKRASDSAQEKEAQEEGFESLRVAAEKQLGQRGSKIAEALGRKAADGDLNSAKFLVAVAEKKESKGKRKKRPGMSLAEQLEREPPWEEPAEADGDSDAGSGGRRAE